MALISRFKTYDEAVTEANRLPYGLAAKPSPFGQDEERPVRGCGNRLLSINQHGLALPENAPLAA